MSVHSHGCSYYFLSDKLTTKTPGFVSLPKVVSKAKSNKPLSSMGIRRSPRLSNQDNYHHIQLDDTPRKRKRQQVSRAEEVVNADADIALDVLPNTSTGTTAPVPLKTLQSWGIQCGLSPGEMIDDLLLAKKNHDVDHNP